MHSKRHRRERQRRAARKFRRAFRRDIEDNGGILRVPDRFRNYVAMCRWFAKAERQAQKITIGVICTGLHCVPLPCGNYAATANPVTVRIAPRKSP